jgi:hypothetical protein
MRLRHRQEAPAPDKEGEIDASATLGVGQNGFRAQSSRLVEAHSARYHTTKTPLRTLPIHAFERNHLQTWCN